MPKFYELQPDIFAKYVPKLVSALSDDVSFVNGTIIGDAISLPMIFVTGHSAQEKPKDLHNELTPIMSDELISTLHAAGVSNLQTFPAELRSRVDGTVWTNYQAVNVIGLISCADLTASEFTHIIDRPGEGSLPLLAFESVKIDPNRTRGALLFRLAESPGTIIVESSVVEYLRARRTDEEWGMTLDER